MIIALNFEKNIIIIFLKIYHSYKIIYKLKCITKIKKYYRHKIINKLKYTIITYYILYKAINNKIEQKTEIR